MSQDGSSAANYLRQQCTSQKKFQRAKDFQLPATDRYTWDRRRTSPNTTPASTVLNSPDLIEVHYQHQHQIKVGRSPVSQQNERSDYNEATSSGAEYDIIFDDIAENWTESSMPANAREKSDGDMDYDGNNKVMEYDCSPRRFGSYNYQKQHPNVFESKTNSRITNPVAARPGFPQVRYRRFFTRADGPIEPPYLRLILVTSRETFVLRLGTNNNNRRDGSV